MIQHKVAVAMSFLKHLLNECFSEFILNSLTNITLSIAIEFIKQPTNQKT